MSDKKQWGGPRVPTPGKKLGRPRDDRAHIRLRVPVVNDEEARMILALSPDARRTRLLADLQCRECGADDNSYDGLCASCYAIAVAD